MALQIMKQLKFDCARDSIDTFHKQVEAMKLAFTDGKAYITQPDAMPYTAEQLLSDEYAAEVATLLTDCTLLAPDVQRTTC